MPSTPSEKTGALTTKRSKAQIAVPTLHERTVDVLRELIVEGNLQAGARIPEQELCEELGVSRTPLREAIKVLAYEGLVTLLANRGAVVTTPQMPEVVDTLEMIGLLEGVASMLCAQRANEAQLSAIVATHEDHIKFSRTEALADYFRANIRFHELIVEGADNRVLKDLHVKLGSQLKRVRSARVSTSSRDEREAFIAEHEELVAALLRRDAMGAFSAAVTHMSSVVKMRRESGDLGIAE